MAKKKIPKKKEEVTEIFEVGKTGKEKIVKTKGVEEVPVEDKNQKKEENKLLKIYLISLSAIILLIIFGYYYTQSQIYLDYKGIEFKAVQYGEGKYSLIFYETTTLLEPNDGTDTLFGFRIRTNPKKLKNIPFDSLDNFNLMKLNAYFYGEGTFDCEGDGVIAMPNFQRIFQKMGMKLIYDPNATCDEYGRYNLFKLVYGDKTEIKEIGPNCYEIVIQGNDDKCEILPATEKIITEMFVKYRDLQ